jgi:hypothetical protein
MSMLLKVFINSGFVEYNLKTKDKVIELCFCLPPKKRWMLGDGKNWMLL